MSGRFPACARTLKKQQAGRPASMSFFRSQGLMAAPFIPLEIELDPAGTGRK